LNLRPATIADVPALMAIETRAVTAAHWSAAQYEALFSSGAAFRIVLVTEEAGAIQGFFIARAVDREWEIENIAVAEDYRRCHLGSDLLAAFLDLASSHGATAVFLEVRESNAPARRLYEKCAFVESGRRPNYYHDPNEAAITYRLDYF
jgi:ribosomal-protein-alanine N-acetyltransferase